MEAVGAQLRHGRQPRALGRCMQLLQACTQQPSLLQACAQSGTPMLMLMTSLPTLLSSDITNINYETNFK